MPELAGISHIDLTVTDLDRSERFYTGVLGFEVLKRVDKADFRLADMRHPDLARRSVCDSRRRMTDPLR